MGRRTALTVWLLAALMLAGVVWMGYIGVQREHLRVPLLEAAGKQNAAEVQRLLNAGADPNARDMVLRHRSAWAAFLDSLPFLRRHRQPIPVIGPTALMIAAAGERIKPTPPDPMRSDAENSEWQTPGLWPLPPAGDDPTAVRLLLDRGADVNAKGQDGWTALMSAANAGHAQIVRLLIQRGASLNVTWQGNTPLLRAVGSYRAYERPTCREAARLLVESGADVNTASGYTLPLTEAVESGDIRLVSLLLDRGAKINAIQHHDGDHSTVLTAAVRYGQLNNPARYYGDLNNSALSRGDLPMVQFLLDRGADVNAGPQALFTPLAAAAEGRQEAMLRFLLTQKADVNAQSADGNTALIWASMKDEPKSVALLLAHGAKASVVNRAGHTALYFADSGPVVRMLLPSGASHAMKTIALELAAMRGDAPSVRLLLNNGADPNGRDWQGRTVLIDALDGDRNVREKTVLAMLRPLLAKGADVNLSDHKGITPLMHGVQDVPTVRLLLVHRADINARMPDGYTALMSAVQNNSLASVRLLLAHGADPNIRDKSGSTALMYAAQQDNLADQEAVALIQLMLLYGADARTRDNQGYTGQMMAGNASMTKAILAAAEKKQKRELRNGLN